MRLVAGLRAAEQDLPAADLKALGIRIVLALFIWMALIVFALAVGLL